ncbi:hypothetical protein SK128_002218 [Halocaridina rubra]|uniref:Zinc finger CCHC domain-containing protein 7 n=1 Tax=Halocaridina rubra TaxID=373956 RepID=A0AAN8XKC2_HALRR
MDDYTSSEFGSGDEDTEFALYAQLYFEPNEQHASADCVDSHTTNTVEHQIKVPVNENTSFVYKLHNGDGRISSSSLVSKETCEDSANIDSTHSIINDMRNKHDVSMDTLPNEIRNKVKTKTDGNMDTPLKRTEIPVEDKNYECNMRVTKPVFPLPLQSVGDKGIMENRTSLLPGQRNRERQLSVCSIDSLPGSVALDSLYCHALDSIDEDEEEPLVNKIMNQSLMETILSKEPSRKKRKKDTSPRVLNDMDDSRCNSMEKIISNKNKFTQDKMARKTVVRKSVVNGIKVKEKPKKNKKNKIQEVIDICDSDANDISVLSAFLPKFPVKSSRKAEACNTIARRHACDTSVCMEGFNSDDSLMKPDNTLSSSNGIVSMENSIRIQSSDSDIDSECNMVLEKRNTLVINYQDPRQSLKSRLNSGANGLLRHSFGGQSSSFLKSSVDFTKGRAPTKKTPSCSQWTEDMATFYDSDYSDEFCVEDIHDQQSGFGWKIYRDDYMAVYKNTFRYYTREPRCSVCRQLGHTEDECEKVPCCYICSEATHTDAWNCPSFCCLWCGGPTHGFRDCENNISSFCQLCKRKGHNKKFCPDLWRRFHLTTSGNTPVPPSMPAMMGKRVYCFICAQAGHHGHNCSRKHIHNVKPKFPFHSQEIYDYRMPVIDVDDTEAINLSNHETYEYSDDQAYQDSDAEDKLSRPSKLMSILLKYKKKQEVSKLLREKFAYFSKLKRKVKDLPKALKVMKEGQRYLSTSQSPSTEFLSNFEKSMQMASEFVFGYLRRGEGKQTMGRLYRLQRAVERLSRKVTVPYGILQDIANTLESIQNPSIENLNEILYLTEAYIKSSKSRSSKCKVRQYYLYDNHGVNGHIENNTSLLKMLSDEDSKTHNHILDDTTGINSWDFQNKILRNTKKRKHSEMEYEDIEVLCVKYINEDNFNHSHNMNGQLDDDGFSTEEWQPVKEENLVKNTEGFILANHEISNAVKKTRVYSKKVLKSKKKTRRNKKKKINITNGASVDDKKSSSSLKWQKKFTDSRYQRNFAEEKCTISEINKGYKKIQRNL